MRQHFTRWFMVLVILGLIGVAGAVASDTLDPSMEELIQNWAKIGAVQQWIDLDARFYRSMDDNRFVDRSQFRLDQQQLYAQTRLYGGDLPAVSIEQFFSLPEADKNNRRELAAKKLIYVERYLSRVQSQVQKVRENLSSGWGDQISDVTVIGDCLARLGDAIGLDPSNPYAWHLQSYFALCAGDENRSRLYLEGAGVILGHYPEDVFSEMRGPILPVSLTPLRGASRKARIRPDH